MKNRQKIKALEGTGKGERRNEKPKQKSKYRILENCSHLHHAFVLHRIIENEMYVHGNVQITNIL